ncbi:DUF5719 family protein [Demequina sp. NBRC 110052]|uniref:DUF5719 family protein n=1 Tax=Demequina sp. NBRC 110052 TaxID=1570341 RepID=UPI0009FF3E21|nr:DUF5719 family protein [Demequina sp. NBRC 110052]
MTATWIKATTGAVALGALAAVAVLGSSLDPAAERAHATSTTAVMPAAQPAACPAPLTVPVGAIEGDDFSSVPTQSSRAVFGGASTPVGDGVAVEAPVGAVLERAEDGDIASLAALTCTRPASTQWIVAGATTVGASSRLVLTNPTERNIEATVTLYGGAGALGETRTLAVGAASQAELLLEGVEAELPAMAIRVDATGAGVVAALQDSRLDGLQPAGTDWASASEPGRHLVVPAVGGGGASAATLRLMSPEGAVASLTLVGADGILDWPGTSRVELEAGVVTEVAVPLGDVRAIEIDADADVVAAARTVVQRSSDVGLEGQTATDFMWVAAQPVPTTAESTAARVAYAPGLGGAIVAYSPVSTTVTVLDGAGAVVAETPVAARTVVRIPLDLPAGTAVSITGRAAWVVTVRQDPGFLAAMAPARPEVDPMEITTVDRSYVR